MPPAPTEWLFQALASPFALLILGWILVAAALVRWPGAPRGPLWMIGMGLGLAMATGLGSTLLARPFLTSGQVLAISSLWPFGAGLLLALAGVVRLARRPGARSDR